MSSDFDVRRVEIVGPQVSAELIQTGVMAVLAAITSMLIYIWFRFEWQFSIAAILALAHDVLTTIGLFSLTAFEFNLATVAAILTMKQDHRLRDFACGFWRRLHVHAIRRS